jgi:hypothetical protein
MTMKRIRNLVFATTALALSVAPAAAFGDLSDPKPPWADIWNRAVTQGARYTSAYYFGNYSEILEWSAPEGGMRRLMHVVWFHWFAPPTENRYGCEVAADYSAMACVDYDSLAHSMWMRGWDGNFWGPEPSGG